MEAVKAIETKAEGSFVEIEAAEATVQLPVSALVQTEEEAAIRVAINETKAGADVLEKKDLNTKTPIVEFEVSVLVNGEEKPLTRFDKHIARTIKGEDTFDAKNSVVLRLDDESDDFTAAPTIIKGSKATFKTQHFSKYVVVEHEKKFADIPVDYWAEDYFDKLASRFIFQGRSDNTVAPGEEMRRAQFAALIVRSLGLSAEGEYNGEFTDVDADDWFTDEIQPAIEQGIIQGRKDGTFAPNESVTRQQAAAMLARAMEIIVFDHGKLDKDRSIDSFTDKERIGDWAKDEVELLMQAGVIDGRENGTIFDPKVGTTRAQMAKMLHEYLTFVEFMN
nr:S-layer homology domain-containing protein [Bacillus piscicola]